MGKKAKIFCDVFAEMVKYVEVGICCAVRFNLAHQLPRSPLLRSMEHPLSVNSLMGSKPNSAGGRGKEYTQTMQRQMGDGPMFYGLD